MFLFLVYNLWVDTPNVFLLTKKKIFALHSTKSSTCGFLWLLLAMKRVDFKLNGISCCLFAFFCWLFFRPANKIKLFGFYSSFRRYSNNSSLSKRLPFFSQTLESVTRYGTFPDKALWLRTSSDLSRIPLN